MSRRENTERQILQALEDQIKETGMGGVGINAIAKRAGVSKELIYRYFDGMPGLMLAWMQEQDFWTRNPDLLAADESSQRSPGDLVLSMLRAQIDALSGNETLREVRRWEPVSYTHLDVYKRQVLPMPLRPSSVTTWPAPICRSTPNSTWLAP